MRISRNQGDGMNSVSVLASATVAVLLVAPAAFADVSVQMTNNRVVTGTDGKQTLQDGSHARPGDVLEYHATYKNNGAKPARDLLATLPVPRNGLEYLPKTAFPDGVQASLDGKTYGTPPLMRTVKLPDGKEVLREVPLSEYRFLRWKLGELQPGKSVQVGARMRVVSEQVAEASAK
jgi:uncharacterized repeat protein (TIGR01451 family)